MRRGVRLLARTAVRLCLMVLATPLAWADPVVGWGENALGQTNAPPWLLDAVAVAAGQNHTLALRADRTVVAWGDNASGQCAVPVGLSNVVAVAAGFNHSLALKADGTVVAWGLNDGGQCNVPANLSNVLAIGGGKLHSVALKAEGSIVVWGDNSFGQRNMPADLTNVTSVASGGDHLLALKNDGTVVGWGWGRPQANFPAGLSNVLAVAAGHIHSLALKADGTVVGWGDNQYGAVSPPPGLTNVVGIQAGLYHSLALKADGTLAGWGYNVHGQATIPEGLGNVVAMAGGWHHSVALVGAGRPEITTQPASQAVLLGSSASLSVTAVGSEPLHYQWQRNGTSLVEGGRLSGVNSPTLTIANVQFEDHAAYRAVVSNWYGFVTSQVATLTVRVPSRLAVTSTNDSGLGTLRDCLEEASAGGTITFDPVVFPTNAPATIFLTNGLPALAQGGVTVDGSDAGVILDGSRIGETPEWNLIDDVSLSFDSGTNVLQNGGFCDGLNHWLISVVGPGQAWQLQTNDWVSAPACLDLSSVAHGVDIALFYDTTNRNSVVTNGYFADPPWQPQHSTLWIPVSPRTQVQFSFWKKSEKSGGLGLAEIWGRRADGGIVELARLDFGGDQTAWRQFNLSAVVSPDTVAVAVEIVVWHSQRWQAGLWVSSAGNTIRGLQTVNFPGNGIVLDGANNTVGGNRTLSSGPLGQGNLFCGNGVGGIELITTASNSVIVGNYVGTDVGGSLAESNRYFGIRVSSAHNLLGGSQPGEGNVISGNGGHGLWLTDAGASDNRVVGNVVGLNATATGALGNAQAGVVLSAGSSSNMIGGSLPGDRNLIGGNGWDGIYIVSGCQDNEIRGNFIGVDATGQAAVGNGRGMLVWGSDGNIIGGSSLGEGNLIAGNAGDGIMIGAGSAHTLISGNFIGVDVTGRAALGNNGDGVNVGNSAAFTTIGGSRTVGTGPLGEGNVISGNGGHGILFLGAAATSNCVSGNLIGTDITGTKALGNEVSGIWIWDSGGIIIGGSLAGEGNVISGNGDTNWGYGVVIGGSLAVSNRVLGNFIGVSASGTTAVGNRGFGIEIAHGASGNTLGGSTPAERNVISGNRSHGVVLSYAGSSRNAVLGNFIGPDLTGTNLLGNGVDGVALYGGCFANLVGGNSEGAANVIAGNSSYGIQAWDSTTRANTFSRNSLFQNGLGGIALEGGANDGIAPPSLVSFTATSITGSTQPGYTVEVFSGDDEQGRYYEGTAVADGAGRFALGTPAGFRGAVVTATTTDPVGNTSEFGGILAVTSTNDSGPGTLRDCLEKAASGCKITFDPAVFPPNAPGTIFLTNSLPALSQGGVTIDASDAGVILDGSRVGSIPEATLLDDVSVSFDHGANVLSNGDFSAGFIHWSTSDTGTGHARLINTSQSVSPPQSYQINSTARALEANTFYDSESQSVAFSDWPADSPNSTIWMAARPGQLVTLRFSYQTPGSGTVYLLVRTTAGTWRTLATTDLTCSPAWQQGAIEVAVPTDGNGVALQFRTWHSERHAKGIHILSSSNTIRGLQIVRFISTGILLDGDAAHNVIGGDRTAGVGPLGQGNLISGNGDSGLKLMGAGVASNTLSGNLVGTDLSGTKGWGNDPHGLYFSAASFNTVGGRSSSERNVLSGNSTAGIRLQDNAAFNSIVGNYIGTDATGLHALGNGVRGIVMFTAPSNRVGGLLTAERNVISANHAQGLYVGGAGNLVLGNCIGVGADGVTPLGNWSEGVLVTGNGRDTRIGGEEAGAGNIISANGSAGVSVSGSGVNGVRISRNSIFLNGGAGISLSGGGNSGILAPRLMAVSSNWIVGVTSLGCLVELFSDTAAEGKYYEGTVVADAEGRFSLQKSAGFTAANPTATATDSSRNTSAFGGVSSNMPPIILAQPQNQIVRLDTSATFSVSATGTAPLGYQWRLNGTPLSWATNATLVLTNVQFAQAGDYAVVVSNAFGAITSAPASLVITLRLEVAALDPDRCLRLTLYSLPGKVCEVWASTNLTNWEVLGGLTNATGTALFTDPVTNLPCRFYRLRQLP